MKYCRDDRLLWILIALKRDVPDTTSYRPETVALSAVEDGYGLLRYIKKPFYPYPELRVKDCDYADNGVARIDEPGHIWTRRYD